MHVFLTKTNLDMSNSDAINTAQHNCLHSSHERSVQAVTILLNVSPLRIARITGEDLFYLFINCI